MGHSTGGGEAARYVARHGNGRVAKLVLIGAVPPMMVKTPANAAACPSRYSTVSGSDSSPTVRSSTTPSRVALLRLQPVGREGIRGRDRELVAAGHDGRREGPLRRHQGVFGDGLHRGPARIDVPTLVMHGDDDQIVPIADSALLSVKLLKNGSLKVYEKFPLGMCTTHHDEINADLLAFFKA